MRLFNSFSTPNCSFFISSNLKWNKMFHKFNFRTDV
jgi:hypothetical protein